jgi:hypothetical protein
MMKGTNDEHDDFAFFYGFRVAIIAYVILAAGMVMKT